MDWRDYIPHALLAGIFMGFVLAALLVPIKVRREKRRIRELVEASEEMLREKGHVHGPQEPLIQKSRWKRMLRAHKGYYGSGV